MPVPRQDPLLHAPRAFRAGLQELLVVVRFDQYRVRGPDPLVDQLRGKPEIGEESQRSAAVVQDETDRFHGIVRNGKALDIDIANAEIAAGDEQSPILRS